ncbi:MAG: alpha/beta hydrolase [Rhodobacteraceae bacterium]|nr:alpha/beta hydrolase [Paracoccaceae bacterium]
MTRPGQLSVEAHQVLSSGQFAPADRSARNLPSLRARTKAAIAPAVERVLRATGVTTRDITINGVPCMEVSPPERTAPWPILYGFGGGFIQGSPFEELTITAPLCAMTGARLIVPDYRLAPEHPWPAAVEDGYAVYRKLAERRFAIVGESAGGNLALVLMQRARAEGLALPGAVALLSPWCDLSNPGDSLTFNDGRDPSLSARGSRQAVRHYVGANPVAHPDISPINGMFDADFPPFVITTGTRDLHLSQAVQLSQVLRDSGVPVDLQVWDGLWHVFEFYDHLPEARHSIRQIAAHLQSNMNR